MSQCTSRAYPCVCYAISPLARFAVRARVCVCVCILPSQAPLPGRPDARANISGTRHAQILAYNRAVQAAIREAGGHEPRPGAPSYMCTAVSIGNVHEVNPRDKALIASALDQCDAGPPVPPSQNHNRAPGESHARQPLAI